MANLHEYQGKDLLDRYVQATLPRFVAKSAQEAVDFFKESGWDRAVVKAQVHAGGRGKAGGVKIVDNADTLAEIINGYLGSRLVTHQTDSKGQPIHQVLLEKPCAIKNELYLGLVLNRSTRCVTVMASQEGGVDIEKVADETPDKIHTFSVHAEFGVLGFQARDLAKKLGFNKAQTKSFAKILASLYQMYADYDLSMIEINPLVITEDDELLCLDVKVNVDDNAMYRHPELVELCDPTQEDERENHAKAWELNYIALEGNIGCMVNGAGLAMATMDLIKLKGGEPANFLDVGGGATAERVAEAFKIICSDDSVKAILVNIFGGIVRCDLIADGVIQAVSQVKLEVPVVVRLVGNNAEIGLQKLADSGLNIVAESDFDAAAERVVTLAK